MNSISLRRLARRTLFVLLWLALTLALLFGAGLRFNPTPSLPKGIYRIVSGAPAPKDFVRGELVSFCLEGEFAELALERGYLEPGSCPSGLRPLLKRLAGLPGDVVPSDLPLQTLDSLDAPYLRFCNQASFRPAWPWCWPTIPAVSTAAISGLFRWIPSSGSNPFFSLTPKEIDYAKQGIFTRRSKGYRAAD